MSDSNKTSETDNQDLTVFVQQLLEQMQSKFQKMSDDVINRIDSMGGRIDELEKSINELMNSAGISAADLEQKDKK